MTDNNVTEEIQRIRYYLIDYENVHQAGLNGIEKLTGNDKLIIFYTTNAETLTFSLYEKLVSCKAKIQLYKVQCGGKNALDFQIATFLGYVLGNNPDTDCHIISNDKGYEYVRSFWKEKNVKIKISSDITEAVIPETDFDKAVEPLNLSKADKLVLFDIYNKALQLNDSNKISQQINNQIGKTFGSQNQKEYYQAIKQLIKEDSPVQNVQTSQISENPETDFDKAVKPLNLSENEKDIVYSIFKNSETTKDFSQRRMLINQSVLAVFKGEKSNKYLYCT